MTYVRKLQEYDSFAQFPVTGDSNHIYLDLMMSKMYLWDNNKYTELVLQDVKPDQSRDNRSSTELELRAQIAKAEKDRQEAQTALGIIAAANRRVGYAAMILFVMWLNGFRYIETKWEMFFSLFGYTVYLSLVRTVDWFSNVFTGFFAALIEMMQRVGGPGI